MGVLEGVSVLEVLGWQFGLVALKQKGLGKGFNMSGLE
jgi:hypothetical protein